MLEVLKPYKEAAGDIVGFWRTAAKFGDPLADLALDFHRILYGRTPATRVAISKLELAFTGGDRRLNPSALAELDLTRFHGRFGT
jgi:hypothetical protein